MHGRGRSEFDRRITWPFGANGNNLGQPALRATGSLSASGSDINQNIFSDLLFLKQERSILSTGFRVGSHKTPGS